ncbi:hypothetical protein TREES_T100016612 [Tupaia chinensis]|uniref:Uncharacterized protein n=1 Tax=Tupaia chinensis TaxID=246437 RepID=L9LA70_TUPCH|nr:hypothetical protein TREES_T100016612 [Tupaia chinensis]
MPTMVCCLGVLASDLKALEVAQPSTGPSLQSLLVFTQLVVQTAGRDLAVFSILSIFLSVQAAVWDHVLAWMLQNRDRTFRLMVGSSPGLFMRSAPAFLHTTRASLPTPFTAVLAKDMPTMVCCLGVLASDLKALEVAQPSTGPSLQSLLVFTQLVVQTAGRDLAVFSILSIFLSVQAAVWDHVLAWMLQNRDRTFRLMVGSSPGLFMRSAPAFLHTTRASLPTPFTAVLAKVLSRRPLTLC